MNIKILSILFCLSFCKFFQASIASYPISEYKHNPYPGYQSPTDSQISELEQTIKEKENKRLKQIQQLPRYSAAQPQPLNHPQDSSNSKQPSSDLLRKVMPNARITHATHPAEIQRIILEVFNFKENITPENFNQIQSLQQNNFVQFQQAMIDNNFAMEYLKKLLFKFQPHHNSQVVQTSKDIKESVLCLLIQYCSSEQLSKISPETGQNIVHRSIPLHWMTSYIHELHKKVRFDIPTTEPDKHPGSTIFHSLAQQYRNTTYNFRKIISITNFLELFYHTILRF